MCVCFPLLGDDKKRRREMNRLAPKNWKPVQRSFARTASSLLLDKKGCSTKRLLDERRLLLLDENHLSTQIISRSLP
jgi:hypothetical protein